ncbi:hypothetical protein AKJ09_05339 [Labilithrix luteola]|uniref:Uncharacterized protein n=2 Tax=Labilithrix luteola TaxID=1391654 RepID=A0A0K1PYR8_9BACT|nr:hypothetical protein AKJ09_05339 [Labilithrix luteola]
MLIPADLEKLPARDPREVLRTLFNRRKAGTHPAIRLYLSGGHRLAGRLLNLQEDRGREYVVLLDEGDEDLSYVPLDQVFVVTVRRFEPVAHSLSFGAIPRPLGETPPTRLEVQRQLASLVSTLEREHGIRVSMTVEPSIPDDSVALANLRDLLDTLGGALRTLAKDALGRSALSSVPRATVRHTKDASLSLAKRDGVLEVTVDLFASLPFNLELAVADDLQRAL